MAKDLTQMPIEKLWARARGALDEIQRRIKVAPVAGAPLIHQGRDREGRDVYAPPVFLTLEQEDAAAQATIARRLATSKRIPKADPLLQQLWEQTQPRPAPRNEVTMADHNGVPVPDAE